MDFEYSILDLALRELLREVHSEVWQELQHEIDEQLLPAAKLQAIIATALMALAAAGAQYRGNFKVCAMQAVKSKLKWARKRQEKFRVKADFTEESLPAPGDVEPQKEGNGLE